MLCNLIKIRNTRLYLLFSLIMAMSFALTGANISYAAVLSYMPETNQIISAGTAYELPKLVGLKFTSDSPFEFTFMLSKGDMPLTRENLQREVDNIGKYFLGALTLPEDDLWVNLSPYEQDRISTEELAATDLGKDMLGEDYVLKQLVSSVTYPESESGKKFWGDIYKKVKEKLGTTNISVNTFNKVWIMPDKIRVVEADDRAAIDYAKLKVMMEGDYLALSKNNAGANNHSSETKDTDAISAQTMRDVVIPIIEEEVNTGKHFAHLRQIYSAIIMAVWFKKKLAKTILNEVYFDKKKIKGADADDPQVRQKIYNEYTKAFREGVYNYLRRDRDPVNSFKIIKRRYVSGGIVGGVSGETSFAPVSRYAADRTAARKGTPAEARVRLVGQRPGGGDVFDEYAKTRLGMPAVVPGADTSADKFDQVTYNKWRDEEGYIQEQRGPEGSTLYVVINNPAIGAGGVVRNAVIMSGIKICHSPEEAYRVVAGLKRKAREAAAMAPHPKIAAAIRAREEQQAQDEAARQEATRQEMAARDRLRQSLEDKRLRTARLTAARTLEDIEHTFNLIIQAPDSPIQKISNEDGTAGYRIVFNLNNGSQASGRTMVSVSREVFATPQDAARALVIAADRLQGNAQLEFYHRMGLRGNDPEQISRALGVGTLAAVVADEQMFQELKGIDSVSAQAALNENKTIFGIVGKDGHVLLRGKLSLNNFPAGTPYFSISIVPGDANGGEKYSVSETENMPESEIVALFTVAARLNALPRVKGVGVDEKVQEIRGKRLDSLRDDPRLGGIVQDIIYILKPKGADPVQYVDDIGRLAQAVYTRQLGSNGRRVEMGSLSSLGLSSEFARLVDSSPLGMLGMGGTVRRGGGDDSGTKKPTNTGGLDFAATDKMENAVTGNGVQFSGDKAMAYLLNGKVAGFRLATTKLTF